MARYSELSSAELVIACAGSKDERLWTEFIRRFQVVIAAAVLRTARHWCEPTRAQLDDLIQETYLKLCENEYHLLRSFQSRHEDSIYGFLKVVAANVVHDHFKSALAAKRGAGQAEVAIERAQMDSVVIDADSFEAVSQRLQLEQIDKILRQVTAGKDQERKCAIFWLRHRQGLTASEIASISSIGLTTEGVESVLLRLAIMIRGHLISSSPHREVKVLHRQNRSKRLGT
ncbi:MAG: sigma-70 family RNA polymerase sigma factor [Terriglobales bacterium]